MQKMIFNTLLRQKNNRSIEIFLLWALPFGTLLVALTLVFDQLWRPLNHSQPTQEICVKHNHIFQRHPSLTSDIITSVNSFSHKFKTNFMQSSSQTTTIFLSSGIILIIYWLFSSNKERQTLLCRFYNQILLAVTIFQGQYLTVKVDGSHSLIDITPLSAQISAPKFQNFEALIPRKKCGVWKNCGVRHKYHNFSVVFASNTTEIPPLRRIMFAIKLWE